MSQLVESKVKGVSERLKKRLGAKAIDWSKFAELVMQLLPSLLVLCQKSSTNAEIAGRMKSPGPFERARFRRAVREELYKENDATRRELRRHLDDVCDCCMEEASNTSATVLESLVSESTQYEGFPI